MLKYNNELCCACYRSWREQNVIFKESCTFYNFFFKPHVGLFTYNCSQKIT